MIAAVLLLLAGQIAPAAEQVAAVAGQGAPVEGRALPDHELAAQRGGFRLPSGIDVALTVQTQTAIDGAVVLRTVFRADQGAPTLTVSTPRAGEVVVAQPSAAPTSTGATAMVISYDPRSGIQATPGASVPAVSVTSGAVRTAAAAAEGLQAVDASGTGVTTDAGVVTAARTGGIDTVQLKAADLTVIHLAGSAFGSAIANSGNDRAIDTQTTISIDLSNVGADVTGAIDAAMVRVQDLGSAVSAMRAQ